MAASKRQASVEYLQTMNPKGYVNNKEITNLDGTYLVKGSLNAMIVNNEKVVSRLGYELIGAGKTLNKGIYSSYDWLTNSRVKLNIRGYYGILDFWYPPTQEFLRIKTNFPKQGRFEFSTWWDTTELFDILIAVNGFGSIYTWSGGVTKVASVTANTITKKRYVSGTTISFNDNGASPDTIVKSDGGFTVSGFAAGETVIVVGSTSNDGEYLIDSITDTTITLSVDDELDTEASGASIVLQEQNGTWAQSRFFSSGADRKVTIDGQEYEYTGGENTGTLTGVTPDPSAGGVTADDWAIQTMRTYNPAGLVGFKTDLVSTMNNQVYFGSRTSQQVLISKNTDFADFSFSASRVPGEGFDLTLDNCPTAFIPDEDQMYIGAGENDVYKVTDVISADQGVSTVSVIKLKTATGQAPVSQGAVANIKNAIAFLSHEPTIDEIGRVEMIDGTRSVPISDPIKNDLDVYTKTNVHSIFFRNQLWYTFPADGVCIVYDTQNKYWNAPQLLPAGRFSIMTIEGEDRLCMHSSSSNETYVIDEGFSDNGAPFTFVAAFGYENFGTRFSYKEFDEIAIEAYLSTNTTIKDTVYYEYKGAADVREFEYSGSDQDIIFTPSQSASFGTAPQGYNPFGSSLEELGDMVKIRVISSTDLLPFFERQRIISTDVLEARVAIIALAENVRLSENLPTSIKK